MATTSTWSVDADGDWGDAADWSLHALPNSSDAIVINTANLHTVTFSGGDTAIVYSLTVGQDYFAITGGSLSVLTTASFALGLTQSGGSLGGGAYSLNATSVISGGSAEGSSVLNNHGTLALSNYQFGGSAFLDNFGATNQTGQITLGDVTGVGVLIDNALTGTYDVAGDFGVTEGAASASIDNAGLFEKGFGGGVSTIGVSFVNTGTLQAKSGILEFAGPINTISGKLTGAGEIAFSGGVTNLAAGTIVTAAKLGLYGDGVLNLGGAITITALQDSASSNAATTLDAGAFTLTLNGASSFQGATDIVTGTGAFVNAGTLSLGGELLVGGTLAFTNKGVITDVGAFVVGDGSGVSPNIVNAAGATFNLANNGDIGFTGPAGHAFVNAGALNKNGLLGTSVVSMSLTNTGSIAVASGALDLTGAVNSLSGKITGAGALEFDGSSVSTLKAQALLTLSIAAIDIIGSAEVFASNQQYAGVFTEADAYNQTTTLDLLAGADFQLVAGSQAFFGGGGGNGQAYVDGSGTLTTSGTTTIGGTGMLLGGSATWSNTSTLVENAQLTLGDSSGSAVALQNSGAGAVFELNGNVGIGLGGSGVSTFTNSGLLTKTSGTGTSAIAVDVTSTGTITDVVGLLDFVGADNSLSGSLTGAGAIGFDGGSVTTLQSGVALKVATIDLYGGAELLLPASLTYAGVFNDDPSYNEVTDIVIGGAAVALTLSGQDNFAASGGVSEAVVSGAGQLDTTGATSIGGGGMTIGGTVAWTNSGTVSSTSQLTIGDSSGSVAMVTNSGAKAVFDLLGSAGIGHGASTSCKFINSATLAKSGYGSVSTISAEFDNTGTVTIADSTLDLQGVANILGGTFAGSTGALVLDGGSFTTLQPEVALTVATLGLNDSATLNLSANLTYAHAFNDTASYNLDATVDLNGHTLTLSGAVALASSGGSSEDLFTGGGELATDAATSTANNGFQLADATDWTNSGTVTAEGALVLGDSLGHVSTATNGAAGVYDLTANAGLSYGSSFATKSSFINDGLFEKTGGGAGLSLVDTLFVNNGTIEVTQGTLEFAVGTLTGSGKIIGKETVDGSGNILITA